MTKLRTMFGLCMLCAFAVFAIAAQSASAKTAFTCGSGLGSKDFSDAHCKTKVTAGTGTFGHEAITKETSTTATNVTTGTEKSTLKMKSVQSGVTLELQSTELSGTGTMKNVEEGGEMFVSGHGVVTLKGVTVTAPAGKGCVVTGGEIVSNSLSATTKGLASGVKVTPASGETFAEFTVSGCSVTALNHGYTAKGSVQAKGEGATGIFTHVGTTEQKTLTLSGQNAGLEGSVTIKGENGNGLTVT